MCSRLPGERGRWTRTSTIQSARLSTRVATSYPPPLRGVLVVRPTAVPSSDGPNCIKPDWYGPLYALKVEEEAGVQTSGARYTWWPPRDTPCQKARLRRVRGLELAVLP